jgi:ribosome-binding protein aMBF1 (putative translation factor)
MAEIRRRIRGKLTPERKARHQAIREDVAKRRPALDPQAKLKKAEIDAAHHAMRLLKQARESKGWSLADLSAATGIDEGRLSKLENDLHANPTFATVLRIAEVLQVKIQMSLTDAA